MQKRKSTAPHKGWKAGARKTKERTTEIEHLRRALNNLMTAFKAEYDGEGQFHPDNEPEMVAAKEALKGVHMSENSEQIFLTPEMIKAGASILCGMELIFANEEFYAQQVFRAMVAACPKTIFSPDVERLSEALNIAKLALSQIVDRADKSTYDLKQTLNH